MSTTNLAMMHNPVAALPFHLLASVPPPALVHQTFAAIELSADGVRLKIGRMTASGGLQIIHDETALCPYAPADAGDEIASYQATWFVLATLRRYASLCSAHGAMLRAVATSAFARAWDCDDVVVARAHAEAGIDIEMISSREEACLLSLAALGGASDQTRSLLIDVGPDGARVILASGEQPIALWELGFDMMQAAATLDTSASVDGEDPLLALQTRAHQIVLASRPGLPTGGLDAVVAIAGTAAAVVGFASDGGTRATTAQIGRAVDRLVTAGDDDRQQGSVPIWGDLTLPGAILLEAIVDRLCPGAVEAVDKRLSDGVMNALARAYGGADTDADECMRGLA